MRAAVVECAPLGHHAVWGRGQVDLSLRPPAAFSLVWWHLMFVRRSVRPSVWVCTVYHLYHPPKWQKWQKHNEKQCKLAKNHGKTMEIWCLELMARECCDLGFKGVCFVRYFGCWRPQFYHKRFFHHRGFQSELRADFWRIGKLGSLAFQCISFHSAIRNIASQNRKKLSHPRKHPIRSRFPKRMCFTTF